jgi:putative transposase
VDDSHRREAYRDLFRTALGEAPIAELRMALNQGQPIGNQRFYAEIEATTGQRREIRKRGRPRKKEDSAISMESTQQALGIK